MNEDIHDVVRIVNQRLAAKRHITVEDIDMVLGELCQVGVERFRQSMIDHDLSDEDIEAAVAMYEPTLANWRKMTLSMLVQEFKSKHHWPASKNTTQH